MPLTDKHGTYMTLDSFNVAEATPSAFAGGTTNARGDHDGTGDGKVMFTVTGVVLVRVFGLCTTDLAGATATIELGVAGNTAALIAQTTATDIDDGDIWKDTSPEVGVDTLANLPGPFLVADGADIIETVGTANITSGNIKYYCLWRPISADGNVVGISE